MFSSSGFVPGGTSRKRVLILIREWYQTFDEHPDAYSRLDAPGQSAYPDRHKNKPHIEYAERNDRQL